MYPFHTGKRRRHGLVSHLILAIGLSGGLSLILWRLFSETPVPAGYAVFSATLAAAWAGALVIRGVVYPIDRIIERTHAIARGEYFAPIGANGNDEINRLCRAINEMGKAIGEKQGQINSRRDEYKTLFEQVPCFITVQDRDYRLLQFNREFEERFDPVPGDYCYHAYKGRDSKCEACPVEATFLDGTPRVSEEEGVTRDGVMRHWIARTSPIRDSRGRITAVMEMNLDITQRKRLEEKLDRSEKKYYAIFNNIPNPVFVLQADTFEILDVNESVKTVYGYGKAEILGRDFQSLFEPADAERWVAAVRDGPALNPAIMDKVRHRHKSGGTLFVNIRVSPSEYPGRKVFLVTTSDITRRLEAEQQVIHAGKMATLGEMATGVAHELNQPLTVIKTASSFLMRKVRRNESLEGEVLMTMATEIDSHVDRASKIIQHMRAFGRKKELTTEPTDINAVLRRAFDIFSQQLKLREIAVDWQLDETLPLIQADPHRLEQVFINLLINARDAIEEKFGDSPASAEEKRITLGSARTDGAVTVAVMDNGIGIPDHVKQRIFEPFFTTKKVGKGTGLGLSITYGIITDSDGDIRVDSTPGEGSRFTIEFPVSRTGKDAAGEVAGGDGAGRSDGKA